MFKPKSTSLGGAVAVLAIATAFATLGSGSAQAQTPTPIYSGGGTLAAAVYRDLFNCWGSTSGGSLGTTNGSSCPVNSGAEVLYAPVGTGAGQNAYLANNPATLGTPTSNDPPYTSTDFPNYPYTGLAFGAGDAPLSPTQISGFNSAVYGPVIQVPTLITSVTIPFNPGSGAGALNIKNPPPTVDGVTGTSGLMLSRDNLCGIFSGAINDWSDTRLATDNRGVQLTTTPTTITVVYRHDSSGTTFLTSNALVTQCASSAHPMPSDWGAAGTSYFVNAAAAQKAGTISDFPSNFKDEEALDGGSETGTGGIVDAISGNAYTIGYSSPDYVQPYGVTGHTAPVAANVQNQANVTAGGKKKFIPPGIATATLIMSNATVPATSDPNVWATNGINANPTGNLAYPIGGFTWLFAYTCYASNVDVTALDRGTSSLLVWLYGPSADVPTILNAHGFAQLPNKWKAAIKSYYLGVTSNSTNTRIRKGPSGTVCSGGAKAS